MNDLSSRPRRLAPGLHRLALASLFVLLSAGQLIACSDATPTGPGVEGSSGDDVSAQDRSSDALASDRPGAEDRGPVDAEGSELESDVGPDAHTGFQGCLVDGGHYAPLEELPVENEGERCVCTESFEVSCEPACTRDGESFMPGEDVPTLVAGETCWCTSAFEVQCVGGPDPDAQSAPEDAGEEPDAGPGAPLVPDPEVEPDFSLCSPQGGSFNVYDIQNPACPDHIDPNPTAQPGVSVTFEEVVVTGTFGDTFFVQEKSGGPYSGIACYAGQLNFSALSVGDVVTVWGTYYEFYGLTQLTVEDFEVTEVVPAPEPFEIVHPAHIATGGPLSEMFEGVLVRVSDLETIDTKPDCPHDFGEFMVTGDLRIDDMEKELWDAHLGDLFASITGIVHYTFGEFKLEPRSEDDLDVIEAGAMSALTKCIESDCIAPEGASVTHEVVVNEIMVNPYGDDTGQEWIELHNPTGAPVNLNGWTVKDCAEQAMQLAGDDLIISPGGYLVLGAQLNPALNGGVPVDLAYPSPFYLPNSVGAVLLYDAQGVLVDQTRYSAFDPWESLISAHSLARISPTNDGTQPESWMTSEASFGSNNNHGTPGGPN